MPNRVRYPTDWSFASGCSPPHLTVTQLPSATEHDVTLKGTYTLLIYIAHRRTIRHIPVSMSKTQPCTCLCRYEDLQSGIHYTKNGGSQPQYVIESAGRYQISPVRQCEDSKPKTLLSPVGRHQISPSWATYHSDGFGVSRQRYGDPRHSSSSR